MPNVTELIAMLVDRLKLPTVIAQVGVLLPAAHVPRKTAL